MTPAPRFMPRPLRTPSYEGKKGRALQRALELEAAYMVITAKQVYFDPLFWRRRLTLMRRHDLHSIVAGILATIPARRVL